MAMPFVGCCSGLELFRRQVPTTTGFGVEFGKGFGSKAKVWRMG